MRQIRVSHTVGTDLHTLMSGPAGFDFDVSFRVGFHAGATDIPEVECYDSNSNQFVSIRATINCI